MMTHFRKILTIILACTLTVSCSNDDDANTQTDQASLVGIWKRLNTEDENGDITDDSQTCRLIEFTATEYITTSYMDADCMDEFTTATLPYTRIDDFIYYGEVSADIKVEIIQLTNTSLKLKSVFDEAGEDFDIITYSRQ